MIDCEALARGHLTHHMQLTLAYGPHCPAACGASGFALRPGA